jgi:hypothetical protein
MVRSSFVSGTATPSVGENFAPAMDSEDFRQRWQAILGSLQALEKVTGKDGPPTNEVAGLVSTTTSGPRPATGLQDRKKSDASGASEASPKRTQPSELTGASQRNTLHVLASGYVPCSPNANHASAKIGAYDTILRSQKLSGSNIKSAKPETMADSIKTTSAMHPEFALSPTIIPLPVFPSQADKPSGPVSSPPKVQNPAARSATKQYDSRPTTAINALADTPDGRPIPATTPDAERDGYPSSASSLSHVASRHASCEVNDADQLVSAPQEKSAAVQAAPSPASSPPLHNGSNGQSASGSVSTSTIETCHVPIAPRDAMFEQGTNTGAPSAAALKPENSQHDRPNIRETAMPSRPKLDMGISAMHVAAIAAGTQAPGDARAGQFAAAPTAGVVQVPSNGPAAWVNAHPASVREPFAAIDAGADDAAAKWVLAGRHRAEVGFQDASLGWVSVRAQAGAGGIHAAVIPTSEVAAQVLGTHLAGLNAHMAGQYERLNPVTLSAPDAGSNSRDTGREMYQGNGAGTNHEGQQQRMQEDPEPVQIEPVARSSRGLAEDPGFVVPMQTFTAGLTPINGHVSFVV